MVWLRLSLSFSLSLLVDAFLSPHPRPFPFFVEGGREGGRGGGGGGVRPLSTDSVSFSPFFGQREAEEEREARIHAEHLLEQASAQHVVVLDMAHEIEQASGSGG